LSIKPQNVSELIFEDYLRAYELGTPEYEPVVPGKNKRIDYRLPFKDHFLWFEVKEFSEDPNCQDKIAAFSGLMPKPYAGIRDKIDKAAEKFKEYDGECCSLVVYNGTCNLNFIWQPQMMLAAMFGDMGIEESGNMVLTRGGRLRYDTKNRISAVIALQEFHVGQIECRSDEYEKWVLRASVFENPFATKSLPEDIFIGTFDERWRRVGQVIKRDFVGSALMKLEQQQKALRIGQLFG
jgi:hypothetical protein